MISEFKGKAPRGEKNQTSGEAISTEVDDFSGAGLHAKEVVFLLG